MFKVSIYVVCLIKVHKNTRANCYWFVRASTPMGSNMQKAHANTRERFAISRKPNSKLWMFERIRKYSKR